MIRLTAITQKLQIVLGGAITTNQLPVNVSYSDKTSTSYNGGQQLSNTNSATPVDICSAPAASTIRDVDYISVRNSDTAVATATIRYNDNATLYTLVTVTLAVGDHLEFTHGSGWKVTASNGAVKLTAALLSPVITGSPTAAGSTWTDLGAVTTADINGGTLDGVTVGGATPAAITGTTITGTDTTDATSSTAAAVKTAGGLAVAKKLFVGTLLDISTATAGQVKFPATQNASADPNTLDDYDEYTAASTACTGAITTAVVWKLTKSGNKVTLTLPVTEGTASAASNFVYGVLLPAKYRPSADLAFISARIKNNAAVVAVPGMIYVGTDGTIYVYREAISSTTFTAGAAAGLTNSTSVSWTI